MRISGALEKKTKLYINPNEACKNIEYICPGCSKDILFCKGKKIRPYFKHKPEKCNPCTYYNHSPSESDIHIDGKHILKRMLKSKKDIIFTRFHRCCRKKEKHIIQYPENYDIVFEFRFKLNGNYKSGDVVMIDQISNIVYIFEIKYKHATRCKDRPEPWFEIDAEWLRQYYYKNFQQNVFNIDCSRDEQCIKCEQINIKRRYRLLWRAPFERIKTRNLLLRKEINKRINEKIERKKLILSKWKKAIELAVYIERINKRISKRKSRN